MWLSSGNPECQKWGCKAGLDKWNLPQKEPPTPACSPTQVGGGGGIWERSFEVPSCPLPTPSRSACLSGPQHIVPNPKPLKEERTFFLIVVPFQSCFVNERKKNGKAIKPFIPNTSQDRLLVLEEKSGKFVLVKGKERQPWAGAAIAGDAQAPPPHSAPP